MDEGKWCGCLKCGTMGTPSQGWSKGAALLCYGCKSDRVMVQRDDETEAQFLMRFIEVRELEMMA